MSYDIFFVRRDPGQTFEDALDGVEDGFEGSDPGPLSEGEREQWDALVPRARTILGETVELTLDDDEVRELTDRATGIGLKYVAGEFEIHVPDASMAVDDDLALMTTVYELARAVEDVTGLEGFDPQVGEPVSDARPPVRPRAESRVLGASEDDGPDAGQAVASSRWPTLDPAPGPGGTSHNALPRRWWEFWKA